MKGELKNMQDNDNSIGFYVIYETYPDYEEEMSEEEMTLQAEFAWDDLSTQLEEFFERNTLVATGTVGTWLGRSAGGKIIDSLSEFTSLFEDDNTLYEDEKGNLFLRAAHHDGTNYISFRKLNKYGRNYYLENSLAIDNEYDKYDRRTICERLMKPRYSKRVQLRKELGWI